MKRKFIFLAMLLLTLVGGVNLNVLNAQVNTVTVGYGSTYSSSIPLDIYNGCGLCQQLYLADEIGYNNGGVIKSMAIKFYGETSSSTVDEPTNNTFERKTAIYIRNTEIEKLDGGINLGEDDILCFDGTITYEPGKWAEFVFNGDGFQYNGGNILVTMYDYTNNGQGYYKNYYHFYADEIYNRSVWRAITAPVDDEYLKNLSNKGLTNFSYRNQIKLNIAGESDTAEPVMCNILITMTDQYGDGWNNNKLEIKYGGTTDTYTVDNGKKAEYEVSVPSLSDIIITYLKHTSSSWPEENGFVVKYESGEVIHESPQGTFAGMANGTSLGWTYKIDCSPKRPSTPTIIAEPTGSSTIVLKMSASGAESYNIYNGTEIVATGVTESSYTVEGLSANKEYCFTVTAGNEVGESEPSEEVCATTFEEGTRIVSIGEGDIAQISAPIYNAGPGPVYSLSQQIYTAEEIGLEDGTSIKSISFHHATGNNNARNIVVYLKNTDNGLFEGNYDWIEFSDSDKVYEGEFNFGIAEDWVTINFQNAFEYTGGNVAVIVYDKTGTAYGYTYDICDKFYSSQVNEWRGSYVTKTAEMDFSQLSTFYGTKMNTGNYATPKNVYYINNVKFRAGAPKPSVKVQPGTIAFGDVRAGEYWSQKDNSTINVSINATLTTISNITCDNDFFVLPEEIDYTSNPIELTIGYNKNAAAGEYTGNLIVTYDEGKTKSAPITATVYAPIVGDVIENPIVATFDENGSFTYTITSLEGFNDDYIFSENEQHDANCNDLVFKMTIEEGIKFIVSSTNANCWIARYDGFTVENGPASIQNYPESAMLSAGTYYYVLGLYDYNLPFTFYIERDLPAPSNLTVNDYNFTIDEEIVLSWDAVDYAIGYNIYAQADENSEYEFITRVVDNEYTTTATKETDYPAGYYYAVSALYEGDIESSKTRTYDKIKVLGNGTISGKVTDKEGEPIEYARIELDNHLVGITNEDGIFESEILEGSYTLTVSHYDYEQKVMDNVVIDYNNNTAFDEDNIIVLTAKPAAEGITITATNNETFAKVTWDGNYDKYNVYRKDADNQYEIIASEIEEKTYADEAWANLDLGTYQYGVSGLTGGENTLYTEDFEAGAEEVAKKWEMTGWTISTTDAINGYSLRAFSYGAETKTAKSPVIQIGELAPMLKFKFKNTQAYTYTTYNTLSVKVSIANNDNWNTIETYSGNIPTTASVSLTLNEQYIGKKIQILFELTTVNGGKTIIDDIEIVGVQPLTETKVTWCELTKYGPNIFTGTDKDWNNKDNWSNGVVPTDGAEVIIAADVDINKAITLTNMEIASGSTLTLNEKAKLTVTGKITKNGTLVINDGAELFQNSEITATFNMSLRKTESWNKENNEDGWQFISSPFTDALLSTTTGWSTNFDLYKYNGTEELEWLNYHNNGNNSAFTSGEFEQGVGYLFSHETKETATLSGTLYTATTHEWSTLNYQIGGTLENFHLLGNPFPFNMDMRKATYTSLVECVAYVNEKGGYTYVGKGQEEIIIPAGDGFFVKAKGYSPKLSYDHNAEIKDERSRQANSINVIATGKAGKDNVVINFAGQSEGFDKLQNFNEDIATVFVVENGKRYGFANVDENATEVELSFVASQMGHYSISLDVNGEFETVTLVDRFTGIETNMLLEDEYTFTATSNDNVNRFVIRLANGQEPTANSQFVYQSGEELILSIEGTVQIVDMLGRVVYYNEHANGDNRINVAEFNNAAYVVRVVNEEGVKSQKVVIY